MRRPTWLLPSVLLVALAACNESSGDDATAADTDTGTPGDGDPGDGDGDPGDGDGDGDGAPGDGDGDGDGDQPCVYPEYAEPMALDQPLAPYSWPTAIHADGTTTSLPLEQAYCGTDPVIDWSIHELLVFISLPAW